MSIRRLLHRRRLRPLRKWLSSLSVSWALMSQSPSQTPSLSCSSSPPAGSFVALSTAAKKELIAKAVDEDAARIDRFEACGRLIAEIKPVSLEGLVAVCFADMNPSEDQFDLLCDTWHAYRETLK